MKSCHLTLKRKLKLLWDVRQGKFHSWLVMNENESKKGRKSMQQKKKKKSPKTVCFKTLVSTCKIRSASTWLHFSNCGQCNALAFFLEAELVILWADKGLNATSSLKRNQLRTPWLAGLPQYKGWADLRVAAKVSSGTDTLAVMDSSDSQRKKIAVIGGGLVSIYLDIIPAGGIIQLSLSLMIIVAHLYESFIFL